MFLLIDQYDSFTYNLCQCFQEQKITVNVMRMDQLSIQDIEQHAPEAIILSSGPGQPEKARICMNIVQHFYQHIPILGVGLGHKIIAASFDGIFRRAKTVKHGKTSTIQHNGEGIFANLPPTFEVMRYDSLVVDGNQLPTALKVTATTVDTNEVMGLQHENYPVFGIQFHPESIGTENGRSLIQNFIKEVKGERVQ